MIDQKKIGNFISSCRKKQGFTQGQLAEKLGITDKAVSKWETGRSMPDLSLFAPLCALLRITPNELLAGEYIPDQNLKEKSNEILMEVITTYLGGDKWEIPAASTCSDHLLVLKNVEKIYHTGGLLVCAVENVSFQIVRGSFVGIMGASGCGKTTLLNLIATTDKPTGGSIEIDHQDIALLSEKELADFRREHLGFVFQEYNLLESMTIYENIAMALVVKRIAKETIKEKVYAIAEKLDLIPILHKYPHQVSGGQRQRCACARAIALNPDLILADEPTGALDSHSARQLLEILLMLRKDYGATILMVTHDALSASYCDKVLFMKDGKIRKVLERGHRTKQAFFTELLETTALLEGEIPCT